MRILFFLLVFLLLGGFIIVSNENLHLASQVDRDKFGQMYFNWFDGLFENFKGLTAYVINTDWMPDNYDKSNLNATK